jgi:3-methylfumaryl-CoA hydratase
VVHGPFSQQCLLDLLGDSANRTIVRFDMRARAPLFDTAPFTVVGRPIGEHAAELWAVTQDGTIALQAKATLL